MTRAKARTAPDDAQWRAVVDALLSPPGACVRVLDVARALREAGHPQAGSLLAARRLLDAALVDTDPARRVCVATAGRVAVYSRSGDAAMAAARALRREQGECTRWTVAVQVAADVYAAATAAAGGSDHGMRRRVYRELRAAAAGAWPVPAAAPLDGPDDPDAAGPAKLWYVPASTARVLVAVYGAGCLLRAIRAAVRRVAAVQAAEWGQG